MAEIEKMRNSQLADVSAPELQMRFERTEKLLVIMRGLNTCDDGYRKLLEELVPGISETSVIYPLFHYSHGDEIRLGERVFVDANCTFLGGEYITIGAHTPAGSHIQTYTPHHPTNYLERRGLKEYAYPVTTGEDRWAGGGATICLGVTVSNRCVIGTGSTVTKDIPDGSIAVRNPARPTRKQA